MIRAAVDWDIISALILPAMGCLGVLCFGAGFAWDEYRHRRDR